MSMIDPVDVDVDMDVDMDTGRLVVRMDRPPHILLYSTVRALLPFSCIFLIDARLDSEVASRVAGDCR